MSDEVKRPRRWMSVVLILSLGLNLLIAGLALGAMLRFHGEAGDVPPGFGPALFRALPDTDRKALRGELADRHRFGSDRRAEDFQALDQALRAVPFDQTAVQELLESQVQTNVEIQKALQQRWLERVAYMTDAERKAYADRLKDVIKRHPDRNRKRD